MTKSKKLYLPKDEKLELFSVNSSRHGIIIPLKYFGYINLHVTIFFKIICENPYKAEFNIHLTNEKNRLKLYEFNYIIDDYSKQILEEKMKKFEEDLKELFSNDLQLNKDTSKLICRDCVSEKYFKNPELHTRELADQFYGRLKKGFNKLAKELSQYPPCDNPKHSLHYNLKTGQFFHKTPSGFVHYKNWNKLLKNLEKLFIKYFGEVYDVFDRIQDEITQVLEPYKK